MSQHTAGTLLRVAFGPFEFDGEAADLRKHGTRVRLHGQPLQILSSLLKEPGQLVTRDEFQHLLWHDSAFGDFEHGLNAAVNRLRQVLGDSADQPRYIETVPGRGYRFIAPVHLLDRMSVPAPRASAPARAPQRKRIGVWFALAVAAGVAGGYFAGQLRQRPTAPSPLRFTVAPPAGYFLEQAGSGQALALSPNGSTLAFIAQDAAGRRNVFVRDFRAAEARLLAHTAGSHAIASVPDDRSIFYTAGGKLMAGTLDGNSPELLADAPFPISSVLRLPRGGLLVAGLRAAFTVSGPRGAVERTKNPYPWAQLLPGGRHLLVTAFDRAKGRHRVAAVVCDKPDTAKDLIEADSRAVYAPSTGSPGKGRLLAVRGGALVAFPFDPKRLLVTGEPVTVARPVGSSTDTGAGDFAVSASGVLAYQEYAGRSQLAWVDRRGGLIRKVGPGGVALKYAALSPDGNKIAAAVFDMDRGATVLWIIDAESGTARRIRPGHEPRAVPVWSPDSKRLLYAGSGPGLYACGTGENEAEGLLAPGPFQAPGAWSPDGRFLAFGNTGGYSELEALESDIWLMDLARMQRTVRLTETPSHEANPAFSPDGHWLAFTSDESGRPEAYLQAFEGGDAPVLRGERLRVSRHGAAALRWSRAGTELFYAGGDGRLYGVRVRGRARPGEPVPLFDLSPGGLQGQFAFDVSADGRRFLIATATTPERPAIVVMQNWEALVHPRGPSR